MKNSSVNNKVVLITGAARGIGAQLARQAVAKGAKVSLVGLEPERLKTVAGELRCHWAECDVTDQAGLDLAVASAVEAYGRIDVVVANAGVANIGTVNTGPVESLIRTVDVNLNGVIRTVSAALPHLIESKGYALLISSVAAFTAMPGMAAYCASKAGVEQFGNVLRLEVAHLGVQVGTAHPIWVDTDLVRDFRHDLPSYRIARGKMPWPMSTELTAEQAAQALLRGVEKRKRRVCIPRSIGMVQAMRTIMLSGFVDAIVKRGSGGGQMVTAMEEESRGLGRSFGSNSVG